jgi:hypothetical protein
MLLKDRLARDFENERARRVQRTNTTKKENDDFFALQLPAWSSPSCDPASSPGVQQQTSTTLYEHNEKATTMRMRHLWLAAVLLLASSSVGFTQASLADGGFGYVTTTDVSSLLNLSLDIRDMRISTNLTEKRNIFENGTNALPYTLAGLSRNASQYNDFPMYNIYKYAFYVLGVTVQHDKPGTFDGGPVEEYANTLIADLFMLNRTRIQGDAALVLNVVMSYWGTLYKMLQVCEAGGNAAQMTAFLDQAAALWVGQGQVRASNVLGFMLYNLAERTGSSFEQDGSSGEALINTLVLEVRSPWILE